MKKFRSRLQSLQRLREQQEQIASAHVAACQKQKQQADQQVTYLQSDLDATSAAMNTLFAQQAGAETVNGSRALFQSQQQQLVAAEQQLLIASLAVEQAIAAWNATRAELKAVSNRIDSQRAAHRREGFLHEEHRQQETAAQSRFQRATEASGATKS